MLGIYRGLCNSLGCCWFIKNIAWVYGGDGYSLDLVCTGSGGVHQQKCSSPTETRLNWQIWSGWWFGTFIFPYIGNNNPIWLIFFRGVGIPPTSGDSTSSTKWQCSPGPTSGWLGEEMVWREGFLSAVEAAWKMGIEQPMDKSTMAKLGDQRAGEVIQAQRTVGWCCQERPGWEAKHMEVLFPFGGGKTSGTLWQSNINGVLGIRSVNGRFLVAMLHDRKVQDGPHS